MPEPESISPADSGSSTQQSEATPPPGTHPSAQQYTSELPYPEELQVMLGGAYVIESFLGQGGMGAVYKGLQMPLRRPVAVKILAKGVGEDYGFEERFKREAYAMAALTHPHIVQVYDCGDAGDQFLFISMELVEGGDLSDALKASQVTPEVALKLMPQICDGLQAAHERGIVHRDIKPANIFLTADGRAKVADFGLAKKFNSGGTMLTKTGLGLGTPDYAAPEQYENLPDIDHRADIYSLGVMFYQLLTGRLPRGAWKAPSSRAGTDPRLDDVVLKAMESDRDERYQTVAELKADILRITTQPLASQPVVAARSPAPQTGAMNTAAVPTRSVPTSPRPSGPVGSQRTGGVSARQTGAMPARAARPGTPAVSARSAAPVPQKKGPPVNLLVGGFLTVVILAAGGWMFTKKEGNVGSGDTRTVELLDVSNPHGRPLRGDWAATADGLSGKTLPRQPDLRDEERMAMYQFDYVPPAEYDFEIEFTRKGSNVVQVLAGGGTAFTHEFIGGASDAQPSRAGIQRLDDRDLSSAYEGFAMVLPPERNLRHVAAVQVRRGSIRSTLNGKEVIHWKGDVARLNLNPLYSIFEGGRLGISAWGSEVIFHRATVREIDGRGEFVEPGAPVAMPGGTSPVAAADVKPLTDWVFSVKGFVVVRVNGIFRKVSRVEDLPASFDRIVELDVPGNRPTAGPPPDAHKVLFSLRTFRRLAPRRCELSDKDISLLLRNNPGLNALSLEGNDVSDAIVDDLVRLPLLDGLNLGYVKRITFNNFDRLNVLSRLGSLTINDTSVSDSSLASIARLQSLRSLTLNTTTVTDRGMAQLAPLSQLESISVRNTDVTPGGMRVVSSLPKMRHVEVSLGRGFKTMADVVSLAGGLPTLKELIVDFSSGELQKLNAPQLASIGDLASFANLTRLELAGASDLGAAGIEGLDKFDKVELLAISLNFQDDDVKVLKGMKALKYLRLYAGKLSEFGALNLVSAVPDLREINRGAFTEAGLKALKENFPAVRLVD